VYLKIIQTLTFRMTNFSCWDFHDIAATKLTLSVTTHAGELTDNIILTYEGFATNYDDELERDRLEFQNGVGNLNQATLGSDGSSNIEADIGSSSLRRYFHRMETFSLADHTIWVSAGIAWRTKERNNKNERAVYTPTTDIFILENLVGANGPTSIIDSRYMFPARLDIVLDDSYFQPNRESQFALNLSQSFWESIQDVYSSEETVCSAYINAYQQLDEWFWRVGLRHEKTNSNTRGALSGPAASGNIAQGQPTTSIMLEGLTVLESFDSLDAAFVEGNNNYDHWLPSLEVYYRVNSD
jgi:hypothetical protein